MLYILQHISCQKCCTIHLYERNLLMLNPLPRRPFFWQQYDLIKGILYCSMCVSYFQNLQNTQQETTYYHIISSDAQFGDLNIEIIGF